MSDNQMCFFADILKEVTPEQNLKDLNEIWPDSFGDTRQIDLSSSKYQNPNINCRCALPKAFQDFYNFLDNTEIVLPVGAVKI